MKMRERWEADAAACGGSGDLQAPYAFLEQAYTGSSRAYHGLAHIQDCLEQLDRFRGLAEHPGELALALWYHDCVYDARRKDNEAKSAARADTDLAGMSVPGESIARIHAWIMDTLHEAEPDTPDGRLIVDIDLSILGRDPEAYTRYADAVRREYAHVPKALYRRGRRKVLEAFLQRPRIYRLPEFQAAYEEQARANLEAEIAELHRR